MSESKWREAVWQPMAEHVLRHMGYNDAEIERYSPPPNHEAMGCEFDSNHMRWDCYDENDTSRHPDHDDVGQVVEIVGVALEADALSPVLAQMKREWQAEAWNEGREQGRRDARGVDDHRHPRSIGMTCHSHDGVTHWHDGAGPAFTMHAPNPYRAEASGREGER